MRPSKKSYRYITLIVSINVTVTVAKTIQLPFGFCNLLFSYLMLLKFVEPLTFKEGFSKFSIN